MNVLRTMPLLRDRFCPAVMWVRGICESSSEPSNRKHTKILLTHNEYRHNIIISANQAENSMSKWKTIKMVPIIHAEKLILDSTLITRMLGNQRANRLHSLTNITFPNKFLEEL